MSLPHHSRLPGTGDHDPRWSLVGGCPAPGSPTALDELAGDLASRAARAQDELYVRVDGLGHGIDETGWSGGSAEAFAGRFAQIPPRLLQLTDAMETSHHALAGWSTALRDLKRRSWTALEQAEAARARQEAAQAAIDAAGENDDVSGHVAERDRAAAALADARRRCDAVRVAHDDGSRQAAAAVAGATPTGPFYADDLHESLLRSLGGADMLAAVTSADAADAHAGMGPAPLSWIGMAAEVTAALRQATGASVAAAALMASARGTAPGVGAEGLSPHPRLPIPQAQPAAATDLTDVEIPTVPVLPLYRDVVPATLPTIRLADVPIPRPPRYFSWFDATDDAIPDQAEPSWLDPLGADALGPATDASTRPGPSHAAPDLDALLGVYQHGGGLPIAGPADPTPVRG